MLRSMDERPRPQDPVSYSPASAKFGLIPERELTAGAGCERAHAARPMSAAVAARQTQAPNRTEAGS